MAVPKRRTSITKKRMRRTHLKKEARTVVSCPNCGEVIQPHRACTKCGFYKGKNVLNKEEKVEEKVETKAKTAKEEKVEAPKKDTKKATTKKTSSKKETKTKETK